MLNAEEKEALLMPLILGAADVIIFVAFPFSIDFFWLIQGVVGGFALLLYIAFSVRLPMNQIKYFAPLASGMLLCVLSLF